VPVSKIRVDCIAIFFSLPSLLLRELFGPNTEEVKEILKNLIIRKSVFCNPYHILISLSNIREWAGCDCRTHGRK